MLKRVFKAFQYRNFSLLWGGAFLSSIGAWMQVVAQAWLVFEITKSPFLLGLDSFLAQIPIVLFSLVGGVVADRMDRRQLLLGSQYVQMSCAFILMFLLYKDAVQIWHILTLSFVTGSAQAFGGPAYQALVPSLVSKEDLPNAIALNSIQFNLARVIGPVLGGLAFQRLGPTWCFGLNGLSFIAVIISLLLLRIDFTPSRTGVSILNSMGEGFLFIQKQGAMAGLIILAFCMTALAIPLITFLPLFAKNIYRGGPETYTLMLAASGLGSVAGALIVAAVGQIKNKGQIALLMLICMGVAMTAFSLSSRLPLSCIFLFICGAALIGCFAMISSLVQLITTNEMRGRVMSVYNVAFRGGMPLGSLVTGWLVPLYSAPYVIGANGILLVLLGGYFLLFQRRVAAL